MRQSRHRSTPYDASERPTKHMPLVDDARATDMELSRPSSAAAHGCLSAFGFAPQTSPHSSSRLPLDSGSHFEAIERGVQSAPRDVMVHASAPLPSPSANAVQPERLGSPLPFQQTEPQARSGDWDDLFQTLSWLAGSSDLDVPPLDADILATYPMSHSPVLEQQPQPQPQQQQQQQQSGGPAARTTACASDVAAGNSAPWHATP